MLASFGFPTPEDDWPVFFAAAVVVWYFCRDDSREVTMRGRVLLLALVVLWVVHL